MHVHQRCLTGDAATEVKVQHLKMSAGHDAEQACLHTVVHPAVPDLHEFL